MTTLAQRIKQARERAGLSQSDLARKVGGKCRPQTIQALEAGKQKKTTYLPAIARALGEDVDWFEGTIRHQRVDNPTNATQRLVRSRTSYNSVSYTELDVQASSGSGALVEGAKQIADWALPAEIAHDLGAPERIRIITVIGDSMEPTYRARDRVFVDTESRVPSPPGVFVIWDGLGLVIKRVELVQGSEPVSFRLSSDNPSYEPRVLTAVDIHIQGRVVAAFRWA